MIPVKVDYQTPDGETSFLLDNDDNICIEFTEYERVIIKKKTIPEMTTEEKIKLIVEIFKNLMW